MRHFFKFCQQGTKVLTCSSDKSAIIWNSYTGKYYFSSAACLQLFIVSKTWIGNVISKLEGHTGEIFSCSFNYEGVTFHEPADRSKYIIGYRHHWLKRQYMSNLAKCCSSAGSSKRLNGRNWLLLGFCFCTWQMSGGWSALNCRRWGPNFQQLFTLQIYWKNTCWWMEMEIDLEWKMHFLILLTNLLMTAEDKFNAKFRVKFLQQNKNKTSHKLKFQKNMH